MSYSYNQRRKTLRRKLDEQDPYRKEVRSKIRRGIYPKIMWLFGEGFTRSRTELEANPGLHRRKRGWLKYAKTAFTFNFLTKTK